MRRARAVGAYAVWTSPYYHADGGHANHSLPASLDDCVRRTTPWGQANLAGRRAPACCRRTLARFAENFPCGFPNAHFSTIAVFSMWQAQAVKRLQHGVVSCISCRSNVPCASSRRAVWIPDSHLPIAVDAHCAIPRESTYPACAYLRKTIVGLRCIFTGRVRRVALPQCMCIFWACSAHIKLVRRTRMPCGSAMQTYREGAPFGHAMHRLCPNTQGCP